MGLAINAASHLRFIRPFPPGAVYPNRSIWEASAGDGYRDEDYRLIKPNGAGNEVQLAGTEPGLYIYTSASEKHEFHAGSYGCYNSWREELSRFALGVEPGIVWENPGRFVGRPFVELINFTDCDGRVGARLAAKLADDFRGHDCGAVKRFEELCPVALYEDFATAFALAARDGVLEFC
jgi:hypothetical protein